MLASPILINSNIRIITEKEYFADEVGVLKLGLEPKDVLGPGDVGYIISGIKNNI